MLNKLNILYVESLSHVDNYLISECFFVLF